MGQSQASQRLNIIRDNVERIMEKLQSEDLTVDDRNRSHRILLDFIKELNLILSKSLRASRIQKVEKLIILALEELATLEGKFKSIEPRLRSKSLQTLHDIEKSTKSLNATLKNQTLEKEKQAISDYKKRISLIEDVDYEIGATKSKVLDAVVTVESRLNEMEIEEKLKMIEEKHNLGRIELSRFVGVSESQCYRKHREYLSSLKKEIDQIPDVSTNVSERKKYLLFNIENNITALEKKVVQNEESIRGKLVDNYTNRSLARFVQTYNEFEKSFTADCGSEELEDVFSQLREVNVRITQKLAVLENQIQSFGKLVEKTDTVSENTSINNRIQHIEAELGHLQEQIVSSTKDTHVYVTLKEKLRDYKNEVNNISPISAEDHERCEKISKVIDTALINLEEIMMDRPINTGDVLIDVMSISSNVTAIGSRLQTITTVHQCDLKERELLENLYHLRRLEIPFTRTNVCQLRDYTIIQIDCHLSNLEKIKRKLCSHEIVQTRNEQMISF